MGRSRAGRLTASGLSATLTKTSPSPTARAARETFLSSRLKHLCSIILMGNKKGRRQDEPAWRELAGTDREPPLPSEEGQDAANHIRAFGGLERSGRTPKGCGRCLLELAPLASRSARISAGEAARCLRYPRPPLLPHGLPPRGCRDPLSPAPAS